MSNSVEFCLTGEICLILSNLRKMMSNCRICEKWCRNLSNWRNLSKNAKFVEICLNGEICRNMSKWRNLAKFVENVFLDFSPYIRKEKPFMWWGPGPWDGCRKRVFGFSHLTWKKRKVIHTAGSLSKKLLEKFQ